jgi:hypothetical protein
MSPYRIYILSIENEQPPMKSVKISIHSRATGKRLRERIYLLLPKVPVPILLSES